jgi:hypothetical protein
MKDKEDPDREQGYKRARSHKCWVSVCLYILGGPILFRVFWVAIGEFLVRPGVFGFLCFLCYLIETKAGGPGYGEI